MTYLEKVYARLKAKYNIEKDELDALGINTEEKVLDYYQNVARKQGTLETEIENDPEPEPVDNYELPANRKKELTKLVKTDAAAEKKQADAKFFAKAADLSHLPLEERVTVDDAQAAMRQLQKEMSKPAKGIRLPKKKSE